MASKIKGLQQWCRKMTEGYPHVDISNFTTAWRNGMAFCAIIHRFRPDLIDYDSLSPENVFENNKLAFEVGESELNIPAFLEADDMARLKVPDKLSVITYVSQYYNYLGNLPQLGGPGVKGAVKKGSVAGTKRPSDTTKAPSEPSNKKTISTKEDAKNVANTASSPRKGTVGDKCGICQNKVYLLERHIEGGKLYHRSCFRHSDLSPTNKVYTKSPFMSPALNKEKATVVDKPNYDIHEKYNNNNASLNKKGNEGSSVLSNLKSGLKKMEGGGISGGGMVGNKHSIQVDKDKEEEAKKAKVQPRNLFAVGGGGTGKENQNSEKKAESESVFPLSGKEAKKLEKRRQEILASESVTPVNKGAKRGMPLIFQTKDKSEPLPSSISSTTSSSSSSKPSANKLSSSRGADGDNLNANPSSKTTVSLNSNSKDTKTVTPGVSNEGNKINSIQGLQSKFSGQSQPPPNKVENSTSAVSKPSLLSNSNQPVARPRVTGSKIASSPFMDNGSGSTGKKTNDEGESFSTSEPVTIRNKKGLQTAPVAVPRKSLIESVDKKITNLEKDKKTFNSSHSHLTAETSSSEDNSTPRSSRSKSSTSSSSTASTPPPALPLSPPPSLPQSKAPSLPKSKPPPLPTSPPPSAPSPSTNHHSSSFVNNKSKLQVSSTSSSSSITTTTTAKIALKSVSPTPTPQQSINTNLVTSTEKKEDGAVLSGLLASLAGVRGRSSSTPNAITTIQQPQQPSSSAKDNKPLVTATATPKTTDKLKSSATTTAATATPPTPSLTFTSNASNRKQSEPAIKLADVKVTLPGNTNTRSPSSPSALKKTIPSSNPSSIPGSNEAKNVLSSLKPVSKSNNSIPPKDKTANDVHHPELNKDLSKLNNAKNENKVGSLVKNYLSKSKEDLSCSGQKPKEPVNSKSEDISKNILKPTRGKDANNEHQPSLGDNVPKKKQIGDGQLKIKHDEAVSPRYDVKLKKVGLPNELGMDSNNSKQVINHKTVEDGKNEKHSLTSDVPQWKKDIEERKKKLREDIMRSETPSKWSDRQDKEKSQPRKDTTSKDSALENVLTRVDLPAKPAKVPSPRNGVGSSTKEDDSKLNWQLEAERRMAAFALFDNEEESKSKGSGAMIEGKITEMNNEHKKRNTEVTLSKLKESDTKYNTKVGLKTVDIHIDINGPQSTNNNNNLSRTEEKKAITTSDPHRLETTAKKDKDTRKQTSPKVSPKLKRKITVLGSNNQKANQQPSISPPVTPAVTEKKKISVIGKFDFDSSTPSDYESSLSRSTEQISIEDQHSPIPSSPQRPPRTKSQRNKAASPKQISAIELQQQLMEIDNRLTDLELRGRDLEDSIRNASFQEGSSTGASSNNDDFDDDDDRLMMEWFQLVSEKNDLVRQEADLVYLSREQDLEDEQEQIDHQLRYLLNKDDLIKSPQEREEESYLLQRKVDIVNQRSSIIDSMDEDRLRYEEEDRGIEYVLKSKGLWKDDGTFLAEQGRNVANSTFYA